MINLPNMIVVGAFILLNIFILMNIGMSVDLQVEKIKQCFKEDKGYKIEYYIHKSVKDIICVELTSGN